MSSSNYVVGSGSHYQKFVKEKIALAPCRDDQIDS